MQAFRGSRRLALKNDVIAHWLHPENADIILHEHGQHVLFEAVEMSVHHVQRHLYRVETELMAGSGREHLQVDVRTLVARETDVADFPGFLRFERRLHSAAGCENAIWIVHADNLVKL